jgi:hypothetical protein
LGRDIIMPEDELPKTLYKYISWNNERSKRMLLQNCIYFTSASRFNDPFDCSLNVQYENITDKELIERIEDYLKAEYPDRDDSVIQAQSLELLNSKAHLAYEVMAYTRKRQTDMMYENFGIFALTEFRDNILMWSHYADSHKGLCIGFDTNKLRKYFLKYSESSICSISPFKINYEENYPIIKFAPPYEDYFTKLLTTKSMAWRYEQEWRFVLNGRTDLELSIPNDILSEVILGSRMSRGDRIEIIEYLRDREIKPNLFDANISSNKFELDLNKIYYPNELGSK